MKAILVVLITCFLSIQVLADTEQFPCSELSPSNTLSGSKVKALLNLLNRLSCGQIKGVISGQNAGHGTEVWDMDGVMGYGRNFSAIKSQTGDLPQILSVDYGHDKIFTLDQLLLTNNRLIEHAKKGGIVTIVWSPISPWLNDESNLEKNPGTWLDTRTSRSGGNNKDINYSALLDSSSEVHKVWMKKLDRIATALADLRDRGIVVLWRPLQEMNGDWFWWGITGTMKDATPYRQIWRHMHEYFSKTRRLDNLLWVFSPNKSIFLFRSLTYRPVMWAYPGDDVVDVIGVTAYDDHLNISDYKKLAKINKPLAVAEYGPGLPGDGELDNRLIVKRLIKSYPRIAYWVSWHSYLVDQGKTSLMSLPDNLHLKQLMDNPLVYTINRPPVE